MSPEVNGNPPSVTKRKKNREKKPLPEAMHNFDLNMPSCNYFPVNQYPYRNFNISEIPNPYYSFMNCPNPAEPMSLPIYPVNYQGYTCPGSVASISNISRHSTLSNYTYNIQTDMPDYMSLPLVNADANDDSKRRFSDPGLPNDSDSVSTSYEEIIQKMQQQICALKDSNNRLSREVMEIRIELNLLKQQQSTTRHYDREYEPGMLADVIREVREAARVREDALLARVKHLIEEKHISVNQINLTSEKNRNNDRICKLEEQMKAITIGNSSRQDDAVCNLSTSMLSLSEEKNQSARQVLDLEREALELRRELQDTRAKKDETEQKLKRLSSLFHSRNDVVSTSDPSEDGKTSVDSLSTVTTSSLTTPRVILSGPVTNL
ncbi:hypothetical protein ABEB36_002995 [Hypothenemus hampei]|uniref:Uncharacterized protein n=1 Tax=Hypothenemus hampei TaxID=57062 RepID=A0ABD1F9I9_HYPHA